MIVSRPRLIRLSYTIIVLYFLPPKYEQDNLRVATYNVIRGLLCLGSVQWETIDRDKLGR